MNETSTATLDKSSDDIMITPPTDGHGWKLYCFFVFLFLIILIVYIRILILKSAAEAAAAAAQSVNPPAAASPDNPPTYENAIKMDDLDRDQAPPPSYDQAMSSVEAERKNTAENQA